MGMISTSPRVFDKIVLMHCVGWASLGIIGMAYRNWDLDLDVEKRLYSNQPRRLRTRFIGLYSSGITSPF